MRRSFEALEKRLLECRKLETIGLVASGIAHNLNSPLAAIILTAEVAASKYPEIVEFKDILESAGRIQDIVSNLADKSHLEQSDEEMEIDLNELLQAELKFLQANLFLKHYVEVETDLQAGLPQIRGRYGDFSFCFFNLVQNALDAMLETQAKKLTVQTEFLKSRKVIRVTVADTGCGIAPEHLARIFEPSFTTKAGLQAEPDHFRLESLGLGLPAVKQILAKYGGSIEVKSRAGRGSQFRVNIPVGRG